MVGAQPGRQAVSGNGAGSARDEVLSRVRSALARPDNPGSTAGPDTDLPTAPARVTVRREYRTRGEHSPGTPELLDLLTDRLIDYHAQVRRCAPSEVSTAVAEALAAAGVVSLAVPAGFPGEALAAVDGVRVHVDGGSGIDGPPGSEMLTVAGLDAVDAVLTGCAVAIAETGTLVLDGGPDQGRRMLTLVPDRHLVVVRADQIVQTVPEALHRLDPRRPLTMISGPSATSDIELDRIEGVHGPRSLTVLLVE